MTTQVMKTIKVLSITPTVRSQILRQLTAKMIYGLKLLTFADSELSECHKFESVDWDKAGLKPGFKVWRAK